MGKGVCDRALLASTSDDNIATISTGPGYAAVPARSAQALMIAVSSQPTITAFHMEVRGWTLGHIPAELGIDAGTQTLLDIGGLTLRYTAPGTGPVGTCGLTLGATPSSRRGA